MPDTTPYPDLIAVVGYARKEVEATGATLRVAIQGASLFTGSIALTRVREVLQCVNELKRVGVSDADIHLVSFESSNWSKTSAVTYVLSVRCPRVELLGEVLGVLTAQKHIQVRGIDWTYPDGDTLQDRLLDRALADAHRKATRMATGLGVRLVGVYRANPGSPETRQAPMGIDAELFSAGRARAGESWSEFAAALSHAKTFTATVSVEYRIEGFTPPQPEV